MLHPHPRHMNSAAARIMAAAVTAAKKSRSLRIMMPDGGTSAALLIDWLRGFAWPLTLWRRTASTKAMAPTTRRDVSTRARSRFDHLRRSRHLSGSACAAKGADVVVPDHHRRGNPAASLAVVNPNCGMNPAIWRTACGRCRILVLVEANRQLRDAGSKHLTHVPLILWHLARLPMPWIGASISLCAPRFDRDGAAPAQGWWRWRMSPAWILFRAFVLSSRFCAWPTVNAGGQADSGARHRNHRPAEAAIITESALMS
jgi:hypothetical protein